MKERRHSVGRKLFQINPYSNDYMNDQKPVPNPYRRIKLNSIQLGSNRTQMHFYYGQQKAPASQRPSTRKESRGRRVRAAAEENFPPPFVGPALKSVHDQGPESVRMKLPKIDSRESKEDINPNTEGFRIVVTRGQPKVDSLMDDYQNNMNLQNYDFNKQKRLSTALSRGRRKNPAREASEDPKHLDKESANLLTQGKKSINQIKESEKKGWRLRKCGMLNGSPRKGHSDEPGAKCNLKKRSGISLRGSIANSNTVQTYQANKETVLALIGS